ncbi:MFS transporter [Kosmotoga pacifica]|uniref:MFS transporter n=1 Tax=Kosmotoga pacifica TaxID=1330330 RepID=A0A0G2ZBB2_9BACT|nr:MFS transporter [Kosmotoga pacifica]AKI97376.1 MFS transporter [Kosmotoga pacifica]
MKTRIPLLMVAVLRFTAVLSFGMLLQLRLRELGISIVVVSALATVRGAFNTLGSPVWGAVSDRINNRRFLLGITLLVPGLLYILYAFVQLPYQFILLGAVIAFFGSAFQPITMSLSTELAEEENVSSTSKEISLLNAASSMGMFIGRILISVLLLWLSVRSTIFFFSIIALSTVVPVFFMKGINRTVISSEERKKGFIAAFLPFVVDPAPMLKNGIWAIYMGSFMRQFGIAGTTSLIAVYLTEEMGLSKSLAVILTAINPLIQIFSHIYFGRLIGKIKAKTSATFGMFLTSLTALLFAVGNNWIAVAIAYFSLGIAFGAFINGAATFVVTHSPRKRKAEFLGVLRSSRSLGQMLGPLVAGVIASHSYVQMFFTMAVAIMLSGFLVLVFCKE